MELSPHNAFPCLRRLANGEDEVTDDHKREARQAQEIVRRVMKRRHWYHCSSEFLGESFTAERRPPRHMAQREPPTPRLCVAPSVAECFAAVLFGDCKPVYAYRTESPRRAVAPRGVWDECVTRERWLIPPVRMILERVIEADEVARAQTAVRLYHEATRKNSSLNVRVAQLAIASEVLGSERERRRARHCCDVVGIEDGESYLLAAAVSA